MVQKEKDQPSYEGILLLRADTTTARVCRENTETVTLTPTIETTHIICRAANNLGSNHYHKANWVDKAGQMYGWAAKYSILLSNLACETGDCTFTTESICKTNSSNPVYYSTTISCGCYNGYSRTERGCIQCPVDTYSDPTNTTCIPCPEGMNTRGVEGAASRYQCVSSCKPGQIRISNTCVANAALGSACAGFVVLVVLIAALRYVFKRRKAVIQQKIQERRARKAQTKVLGSHLSKFSNDKVGSNVDISSSGQLTRGNCLVAESELSGPREIRTTTNAISTLKRQRGPPNHVRKEGAT